MNSDPNKEFFTVDGVEYVVERPGSSVLAQSQLEYSKAFAKAVANKALLRKTLEHVMREQGLWDDDKQSEYDDLIKTVNTNLRKLQEGGCHIQEAKRFAIAIREARSKLRELLIDRNELDVNTAEGMAENTRFNFMVTECFKDVKTGKKVYDSVDAYLNDNNERALEAAGKLSSMMYGIKSDFEKHLPENKFLVEYGFMDEEFRYLDEEGRFVDDEGRLVDEQGRYIDEQGNFVDVDGNPVDEEGEWIVETRPFFDSSGKSVVPKKKEAEAEKTDEPEEAEAEQ